MTMQDVRCRCLVASYYHKLGRGGKGVGGSDGNARVGEGHCCQAHHNTMADAGSGEDNADVGSILSQPGQKNERCTNAIHNMYAITCDSSRNVQSIVFQVILIC